MSAAVLALWTLGLAGGVVATLVILKQAALILRTLRDIRNLAGTIREGAEDLEADFEAVERLRCVGEAAPAFLQGARHTRDAARSLAARIGRLAAAGSGEVGRG